MPKSSGPTSGANDTPTDVADASQTDATADAAVTDDEATPKPQGSPYDLVRVRSERSGNEHTVTRVLAESSSDLKVIDRPAVDGTGKPIPARAKPTNRTDKAGAPVQEA